MSGSYRRAVVDQLVELLADDTLTLDARAELVARADVSPAEREAATQVLMRGSVLSLVAAGALRERATSPGVLDLTCRQLEALAAVWGVVRRWDSSLTRERTLGTMLKTMPTDDVQLVHDALVYGGLISDNGPGGAT